LLQIGHRVRVLDLLLYTSAGVDALKGDPSFPQWQGRFELIQGDLRDPQTVEKAVAGMNAVIHLAAISNDPTGDIDEVLTRQVNFDAVGMLLALARAGGVKRFINASSSSVFGIKQAADVTEDRRNSFAATDQQQLSKLSGHLAVTVNLAPEDPRFLDLRRNVLSKIERAVPNVTVNVAGRMNNTDADRYGEVDYAYAGRTDMSRSTSPREILPLIYGLAGIPPPSTLAASGYPGYPLVMDTRWAMPWLFGLLPLAIAIFWWLSRRPPKIIYVTPGEQS
jgi:hypothetical protein